MKRALAVLLCMALTISITACSSEKSSSLAALISSNQIQSVSSEIVSQSADSSEVASTNNPTKFEQFKSGLDKLGLKYQEVVMGAELIGAVQGIKYKLSNGSVELYKFDMSSAAYKKAKTDKAVTMEGFGAIPVDIQDEMAIMFDGTVKDKDKILDLFKSLK